MVEALSNIHSYQGFAWQDVNPVHRVTQSLQKASATSGVEFSYLLKNATQESGLNPTAKAKTSTATGLFQFVEQTWLRMVKLYGNKYGLGEAADRISIGSDGIARVADKQIKKEILALRKDPEVSAHLAAELTNENKTALKSEVGGKIGHTELYLAHFLGIGGAANFINTMRQNPNAIAADVLPTAASANASVFYDKNGQPQTVAQVYKRFAQKFEHSTSGSSGATQFAGSKTRSSYNVAASGVAGMNAPSSAAAMLPLTKSGKAASTMSSPVAAMMIAQMDADALTATARQSLYARDDENRRRSSVYATGIVG